MAFNPFLNTNEPPAPVTTEVLNPFMTPEPETDTFGSNDNPFATSNPFSDFGGGGYEPPAGDTVPTDIFGGVEPTGAKHFNVFESDGNIDSFGCQPMKPTELDLISTTTDEYSSLEDCNQQVSVRPLPPKTQNLILSVTGQMEFTSSHLLDRIPLTRTPSPVSVRDIHSPSPTELPEDPVLDNADTTRAPPPTPATVSKPTRPPPARPPPVARPPPPRPAPPPVPKQPQRPPPPQTVDNEINLFDAPAPVALKPTKEAIMSLYSVPKKEDKQIDFLSDNIMDSVSTEDLKDTYISNPESTAPKASKLIFDPGSTAASDEPTLQMEALFSPYTTATVDTLAPMDCSEPASANLTPVLSNTSPFAESDADGFEYHQSADIEKNPFGNVGDEEQSTFANTSADIFSVQSEDNVMSHANVFAAVDDGSFSMITEPAVDYAPVQGNIFGNATSGLFGNNKTDTFSSGVEDAFDTGMDAAFGDGGDSAYGASQAVVSSDPGWGDAPEAMMQDAFPESQDAFDAFSAKFDNTSANHMNSGKWTIP